DYRPIATCKTIPTSGFSGRHGSGRSSAPQGHAEGPPQSILGRHLRQGSAERFHLLLYLGSRPGWPCLHWHCAQLRFGDISQLLAATAQRRRVAPRWHSRIGPCNAYSLVLGIPCLPELGGGRHARLPPPTQASAAERYHCCKLHGDGSDCRLCIST